MAYFEEVKITGNTGATIDAAPGAAVPTNAVQVGGSDGTDLRTIATDTTGRIVNVGAAASGSAVAGNPVLVGGSDGTDARTFATDSSGQQKVLIENASAIAVSDSSAESSLTTLAGAVSSSKMQVNVTNTAVVAEIEGHAGAVLDGAPGAAAPANAVQVGGTDGTDLRAISTDSSGRIINVGAAANGSAVAGNPVLVAGSDGTDARTIATDTGGQVKVLIENSPTIVAEIEGHAGATLDSTIGAATAPTNALCTSAVYQTTTPALSAGQAVASQCDVSGSLLVSTEGRKATYRVGIGITSLASLTFPSFTLFGSSSKVIKITKITATVTSGTQAAIQFAITKQSSAWTGGTSSALTPVPHDSADAASSATAVDYSVAATGGGSSVGFLAFTELVTLGTSTVAQSAAATYTEIFGDGSGKQPIVLRGTSQGISMFTSSAVGLDAFIEWTEE
jgi:hypothetical protein